MRLQTKKAYSARGRDISYEELSRRAFDAVADLKAAKSLSSLDDIVRPVFGDIGFPYFAVAQFFTADHGIDTRVLHGSYHQTWEDRYVRDGYARRCRLVREMLANASPYSASDVLRRSTLDTAAKEIWYEARELGLKEGLFTPVRGPGRSYCAVVLTGEDADMADPYARIAAEVLSAFYSSEGRRLSPEKEPPSPRLSARQRECLAWVRHGKSSSDIGGILGRSVLTIDEHIAESCRKLKVRTRIQAAVEATLLGLID